MDIQRLLSSPAHETAIREHRRQTFWQVLFPVILLSLVVLAVIVLLIVTTGASGNVQDTRWANISLIYLLIPTIIFSLVWMMLLLVFVVLLVKLLQKMPEFSVKAQYYAARVEEATRNLADKIASPVISTKSRFAGVREFFSELARRVRR